MFNFLEKLILFPIKFWKQNELMVFIHQERSPKYYVATVIFFFGSLVWALCLFPMSLPSKIYIAGLLCVHLILIITTFFNLKLNLMYIMPFAFCFIVILLLPLIYLSNMLYIVRESKEVILLVICGLLKISLSVQCGRVFLHTFRNKICNFEKDILLVSVVKSGEDVLRNRLLGELAKYLKLVVILGLLEWLILFLIMIEFRNFLKTHLGPLFLISIICLLLVNSLISHITFRLFPMAGIVSNKRQLKVT